MERRLAAIMAADVVGYARLIRSDEEGTLAALKALRAELIDPKLAERNGRVVKLMGDGMLVEFASVVDAVRAAVETQAAVAELNAGLPKDKRIEFRVGVNLGDVVIDGDDIHGDGVNVAARLEGLAEAGGVCISGMVHEGVRDRLDIPFEDLGERKVKNIDRPVRMWRWAPDGAPPPEAARLALPAKPSIAVLPFDNMSGDEEQEYFSDGVAEDIISGLSKLRAFFVIARNSSFIYKGSAVDLKKVGRELGVRYILEGSVRRAGGRVRIAAQLIEAETGNHIWSERYDREMVDIFELQDEITAMIVGNIKPELGLAEVERSRRKSGQNLDAWDLYLRATWHFTRGTREDWLEARRYCEEAISLSPEFARAHAYLANVHTWTIISGYTEDREASIRAAMEAARKAVLLDDRDGEAHAMLGRAYEFDGRFEEAGAEYELAVALNPNSAVVHLNYGITLVHGGNPEQAIREFDRTLRLSPRDPSRWVLFVVKAHALSQLGRHAEAIECARGACHASTERYWPFLSLAIVLAHAGRMAEIAPVLTDLWQRREDLTLGTIEEAFAGTVQSYRDYVIAGARKAGLPE